jgi:putative heme-binding domain-containing protein
VKKSFLLPLLLLVVAPSAFSAETPIFNGRDLEGWSGDPRLWSVENGTIVGRTDKDDRAIKANTFLIYEGEIPGDFQLSYKARVSASNSGVQYRSRVIDKKAWRLGGYQMDLHPKPAFLGMMYEEKGRGILGKHGEKVVVPEGGKPKVTGKIEISPAKLADWNEYRIVARGNVLQHYVNGKLAMELVDEDEKKGSMEGALGLQLHVGPPMVAEFKDLVLSDLPEAGGKADGKAGASTDKAEASKSDGIQWIWGSQNSSAPEKVFFRKEFVLPPGIMAANLEVVGDDAQRTWVNGNDLGMQMDWSRLVRHDVGESLKPGRNVLAVEGRNASGIAGMAMRLTIELGDGSSAELISDGSWMVSPESAEGWLDSGFDQSGWRPAAVVAKMGSAPWGKIIGGEPVTEKAAPKGPAVDMTDSFKVLPGFKLEQIRKVPASEGSWVAMTVDPDGHLICGDQYGKIYRLVVETGKVEALPIPLDGIHGLLWFGDSLYVTVTESNEVDNGVYRVQVSANGSFRRPQLLKELAGRGEHGPHSLIPSPDGRWIYFCAGNNTKLAKMDASLVPLVWDEDQLLPRRPDARGHAARTMAPGGWIARFEPDGSNWQLVGMGLRNEYDIAFNADGDLFTYDADMEWDLGMPWYRPTRINHVIPGAEMGWRNGTGKWPSYSEDSMPEVVNIGPGSPTGLLSGKGAAFPARFQRALYALDWTFATIHIVYLKKEGSTYTATTEELVAGDGLPLTDAQIGKDGHMYFLTGGRRTDSAVWRIRYVGDEPTAPVKFSDQLAPDLDQKQALAALSSSDRTLRQQGRLYFETHPREIPGKLGKVRDMPWETIQAAIIQARLNDGKKAKAMLPYLTALDFKSLDIQQQLAWLRAAGLGFIRGDGADKDERESVLETIDASYPARNEDLNAELVRMLAYLNAPGVVGRTLTLMDTAPPPVAPDWMAIAERNSRYGSTVKSMLKAQPPARVIHYVYALRCVPGPWDRSERERFFGWLKRLDSKSGGKSYGGFLKDLTKETLSRATPEERRWLDDFAPATAVDPLANLPTAKGPGRAWTVEEVEEVAAAGFEGADRAHGEEMFKAALCAACHSFGGQGGAAGPDLTSLAGRFTAKSLADALIDPSQEVSDQYSFDVLTKKGGAQVVGRVLEEKDDRLIVAVNPFNFDQTVEVERGEVVKMEPSPVSPMPGGLINQLNEQELRDLLAYLLGG